MKITDSFLYSVFDNLDVKSITNYLEWLAESYSLTVKSVLDVGCGPGRMLKALSDLGWSVVGLEPYKEYFEQATETALKCDDVKVENIGFNEIVYDNQFDLAVAINGPFSYLQDIEKRQDAIERIYGALKPGGVFFIDMANFSFILHNYKMPTMVVTECNGYRIERHITHDIDFHKNLFSHTDRFVYSLPGQEAKENIHIHVFSMFGFPEIEYFLKLDGFGDIRTYNRYSSRCSEKLTGNRLMVSACKLNSA